MGAPLIPMEQLELITVGIFIRHGYTIRYIMTIRNSL